MTSLTLIQGEAQSVDDRVRAVVRILLAATGMKPVDLAERLDMSKHQVWDRLRGDKDFTVREVAEMGVVFDVPPSVFLMGPTALLSSAPAQGSVTPKKLSHNGDVRTAAQPVPARRPTLSLVAA
jgi:hypothetical protein